MSSMSESSNRSFAFSVMLSRPSPFLQAARGYHTFFDSVADARRRTQVSARCHAGHSAPGGGLQVNVA